MIRARGYWMLLLLLSAAPIRASTPSPLPAHPASAFQVSCGLGSTMTAADVLEGKVGLRVAFAPTRPAEFIAITMTLQARTGQ